MKWLRPSAVVYALISLYIKHFSAFVQPIAFVLTFYHTNKSFNALYFYILQLFRKPELKIMENQ